MHFMITTSTSSFRPGRLFNIAIVGRLRVIGEKHTNTHISKYANIQQKHEKKKWREKKKRKNAAHQKDNSKRRLGRERTSERASERASKQVNEWTNKVMNGYGNVVSIHIIVRGNDVLANTNTASITSRFKIIFSLSFMLSGVSHFGFLVSSSRPPVLRIGIAGAISLRTRLQAFGTCAKAGMLHVLCSGVKSQPKYSKQTFIIEI